MSQMKQESQQINRAKGRRGSSRSNEARGRNAKCISEETLELYVLERLPGQQRWSADDPEVETVEIHLLTCGRCQSRAGDLEIETRELRAILRQLEKPVKAKTFSAGG